MSDLQKMEYLAIFFYFFLGSPFDFNWSTDANESSVNLTFDLHTPEVPKRGSFIPVKSKANSAIDLLKTFPRYKLNSMIETKARGTPDNFKRPYSPVLAEQDKRMCSISEEKSATEDFSEIMKKLNISKISDISSPTTSSSDSRIPSPKQPQIRRTAKKFMKAEKAVSIQFLLQCIMQNCCHFHYLFP